MAKTVSELPRTWVFPELPGLRESPLKGTYSTFPLDSQPRFNPNLDILAILESQPTCNDWNLNPDKNALNEERINSIKEVIEENLINKKFIEFMNQPSLQGKIRSFTGCYLQIGDHIVEYDNGWLIHFMSDQQWCAHWFLYVNPQKRESIVLVSALPYGMDIENYEIGLIAIQDDHSLSVCGDSFEEFLWRFWVENEIAFHANNTSNIDIDEVKNYLLSL